MCGCAALVSMTGVLGCGKDEIQTNTALRTHLPRSVSIYSKPPPEKKFPLMGKVLKTDTKMCLQVELDLSRATYQDGKPENALKQKDAKQQILQRG